MRILAFETSAKAASAAILEDGKLLGEYYQNSGQTHSRTLLQMAENLIAGCDLTVSGIDAVAAAAGPGSFTGVRIGVAAAKGFAWGRSIPCVGVSTLEAMAYSVRHMDGLICCAMDARREEVYNALFLAKDGALTRLTEDRAISLENLLSDLKKTAENRVILVGDGALLCYNEFSTKICGLTLMPEAFRMQRAGGVALAAADRLAAGCPADAAALVPNYLRLSQAERERLKKERKQ